MIKSDKRLDLRKSSADVEMRCYQAGHVRLVRKLVARAVMMHPCLAARGEAPRRVAPPPSRRRFI